MSAARVLFVVGLGNHGPRYAATRHNAGRIVLESLASRLQAPWTAHGKFDQVVLSAASVRQLLRNDGVAIPTKVGGKPATPPTPKKRKSKGSAAALTTSNAEDSASDGEVSANSAPPVSTSDLDVPQPAMPTPAPSPVPRAPTARRQLVEPVEVPLDDVEIRLVRLRGYMNESGDKLRQLLRANNIPVAQFQTGTTTVPFLFLHDELDKPVGSIVYKASGSPAGHNGMRSIQGFVQSSALPRLRIGVDRPTDRADVADYVLKPFTPSERETVDSQVAPATWAHIVAWAEGMVTGA
ncbi:hypothetical protein AMAG_06112 [Allomyces macrogynus ATCC 38327]|uniref:peptidyl-tRNA hydrolase n=1 Tax=Allomyces macrogynus (strain ATCC 38327) TaxID=578462 RepID=A0A0L0SE95_ALLM3|nr:hypothetical protein AMAG_06112 [Allomyces macrogynus ATCC 38327]|eukprot:KNE60754.1 hypothetical protein AMAG_06112 [Allomyces macrogynus ATCC 38327]